ncbi:translation initiation factor 2 [Pseudomonas capsici]|uniref:Translation initiation factor 2 n=1 Tax=Pseudomonas capsici TaxID=2810614 RepID=A0ABT3BSS1_9PSED|nr:translation initiation factor 2 [Pseudomonas capsici]MCV4267871.1 translation initiation factor 2 [Pseudomonas capsici]MCV4276696.1 translation initiation factor 2 [Pseudomonas capsici]MCV4330247.1 translation initiation factor 2 [Pseudomonas capsici]MCV4375900.1 translation initiation factor 2 [Pseudomonas capsici]
MFQPFTFMNNTFRCLGLFVVVLLSACDSQDAPIPKPKVEAGVAAPVAPAVQPAAAAAGDSVPTRPSEPVHELKPGVPVVPVVAGKGEVTPPRPVSSAKTPESKPGQVRSDAAKAPAVKAAPVKEKAVAAAAKREKSKAAKTPVKDVRLPQPKLDLSLPPEMVKELSPPANIITAKRKPLLPQMFGNKGSSSDPSPFELNGRLLSNEMQLQMRNESRRDIEGAALDFKFKQ